jgi:hypothetical protein
MVRTSKLHHCYQFFEVNNEQFTEVSNLFSNTFMFYLETRCNYLEVL